MVWPFDSDTPPPDPNAEPSAGWLTEKLAQPSYSIPYALASGLLSAASPGTARLSHGVNTGVGLGMGAEKSAYDRAKQKRLSEALNGLTSATTPTTVTNTGFDPNTANFSFPEPQSTSEPRLSDVYGDKALAPPAALPNYQTVEQKPLFSPTEKATYKALSDAGYGQLAATAITKKISGEKELVPVGRGGLYDKTSGTIIPPAATPTREPTPPRPVFGTQGRQAVSSVFNPETKQWETTKEPLTAAPARALSPEDKKLKEAQTQVDQARVNQIKKATEIAGDAKRATVGQLAQALNSLNTAANLANDETETTLINNAKTAVLGELAIRRQNGSTAPRTEPTPGKGSAPIGTKFDTLPPAENYKGAVIRKPDGSRVKSDGKSWNAFK